MVKVTIDVDGEIYESQGDCAFGGVVTFGKDACSVHGYSYGRTSKEQMPVILAESMCKQIVKMHEDKDEVEQIAALAEFADEVNKITKNKIFENTDVLAELFKKLKEA